MGDSVNDTDRRPIVLIIDIDLDIVEVVTAVLGDEGYEVTAIDTIDGDKIARTIGQLEPDCILLDSVNPVEYGEAWRTAAQIRGRGRPIPTVMFTAHIRDIKEAMQAATDRALGAGFAAIVPKPFRLDELLAPVETAVGQGVAFNRSAVAEHARTRELVKQLANAGAMDIAPSKRREWANFRNAAGDEMQLYWWQRAGQTSWHAMTPTVSGSKGWAASLI